MSGHYSYLVRQREAVLSGARMSNAARARAMGRRPVYQPAAKTHTITVDCAKPEERTVKSVAPAPPKPAAPEPDAPPAPFTAPKHWKSNRGCNPILEAVTIAFNVTLGELLGPKRSQRFARARFAAAHLIKKQHDMSLPQIGRTLKRDHTTVMHELMRAKGLLGRDDDWTAKYYAAEHLLSQS